MKKFGLIGHPIEHSQSPALFRAAYAGKYQYDLIQGAEFEASWQSFLDEYDGINVTAPFKENAFAKADCPSAECQLIGATNLLVKTKNGIEAYNSDFRGVDALLREENDRLAKAGERPLRTALIVGCGGAAKAAAAAAYILEMDVTIANRSVDKAKAFAEHLELFGVCRPCSAGGSVRACGLDEMPSCDLTIYCLPMAIPGIESLKTRVFLEANYRDPAYSQEFFSSDVINAAKTVYICGSRWLIAQAQTGYSLLTGEQPDSEAISNTL